MTRVCAGCLENYGSFCSTNRRLLLSAKCQDQPWNPPTSYSLTISATSLVAKRSGCKDDHSHSFSAEVKNEWKYTSIPHTSPSCAQRQLYFYPYHTVEKTKCKKIRNIFFTDDIFFTDEIYILQMKYIFTDKIYFLQTKYIFYRRNIFFTDEMYFLQVKYIFKGEMYFLQMKYIFTDEIYFLQTKYIFTDEIYFYR